MGDRESFSEKKLKQIRSGEQSSSTAGTRKISRLILVIDAIFIVLILVFFYGKESGDKYHSSTMKYDDISLRFSINTEKEKHAYQCALTLKSDSKKVKELHFTGSLGRVHIMHENTVLFNIPLGDGIKHISFLPDEVKTFIIPIEGENLDAGIRTIPSLVEKSRPSLLKPGGSGIPLKARITLNLSVPVSTEIEFIHEVSQ